MANWWILVFPPSKVAGRALIRLTHSPRGASRDGPTSEARMAHRVACQSNVALSNIAVQLAASELLKKGAGDARGFVLTRYVGGRVMLFPSKPGMSDEMP